MQRERRLKWDRTTVPRGATTLHQRTAAMLAWHLGHCQTCQKRPGWDDNMGVYKHISGKQLNLADCRRPRYPPDGLPYAPESLE